MNRFTVGSDEYEWKIQSKKPIPGKDQYCLTVIVRRMRDGKEWTGAAHINLAPSKLDVELPEWLERYTFGSCFQADTSPNNFEIVRGVPQFDAPLIHRCASSY
jgi:hypothetical protein